MSPFNGVPANGFHDACAENKIDAEDQRHKVGIGTTFDEREYESTNKSEAKPIDEQKKYIPGRGHDGQKEQTNNPVPGR